MLPVPAVLILILMGLGSQAEMGLAAEGWAQVKGMVLFRGIVPEAKSIQVTADEGFCGKEVRIQPVQVHAETLGVRHAVVSIQGIITHMPDDAGSTRVVVNAKCAFSPRVSAGRIGETLEIQNLDPILHNTHVVVGKKTIVNVAQVAGSRPIPKTLKRTGLYAIRCDKHTFMAGALQVFDHPYFTVTDEFGAFQLPRLPAGSYTLVIWHETLGRVEQEISVPSQGSVALKIEYPS
ncbi:MAG: hypothetical protein OEZ57_01960 [Nitrospirota bacterium]|nr:hypothetical protein [Nitrospirota bacterium]MDH5585354.1 hypothetical protein [Nitrospirota bacterium]MDH5773666.1 hypothetical protein [Nitrospirota bacterium]